MAESPTDLERVREALGYSLFSDEFNPQGQSYLLHLTRLIDRTTDLYKFCPVVPIRRQEIDLRRRVRIRAAYPKVRAIDKHSEETWNKTHEAISGISEGGDKADDKTNLIESYLEREESELIWRRPNNDPYQLTEPSLSYIEEKWKRNIEEICKDTFRSRSDHASTIDSNAFQILMLPEFAFPPMQNQVDRNNFLRELRRNYIKGNIGNIRTARDFLFLGSYHDAENNHNIGVSFPFGLTPLDSSLRQGYQHQGNDGIYYQRKRNASKKLGEVLAPVSTLDFPVFVTDVGRVAVLICSDIYDLSLFLGLVRYNLRSLPGAEINYILVPAFNRSRKLVETCRQLSFLMNNVVVYCTSYPLKEHSNVKFCNHSHLFVCGRSSKDLFREVKDNEIFKDIITISEPAPIFGDLGFVDYSIDPAKVSLLRLLTRKKYSRAIQEGGRRTHSLHAQTS